MGFSEAAVGFVCLSASKLVGVSCEGASAEILTDLQVGLRVKELKKQTGATALKGFGARGVKK